MNCVLIKKSDITRPMPGAPEPTVNPGEYALIDNEDGTLTLTLLNSHRDPSPIDPSLASLTVQSADSNTIEITDLNGFTWRESVTKSRTRAGGGGVVDVSAIVRWIQTKTTTTGGGTGGTHTVTWRDKVSSDPSGAPTIDRSDVNVTQP